MIPLLSSSLIYDWCQFRCIIASLFVSRFPFPCHGRFFQRPILGGMSRVRGPSRPELALQLRGCFRVLLGTPRRPPGRSPRGLPRDPQRRSKSTRRGSKRAKRGPKRAPLYSSRSRQPKEVPREPLSTLVALLSTLYSLYSLLSLVSRPL